MALYVTLRSANDKTSVEYGWWVGQSHLSHGIIETVSSNSISSIIVQADGDELEHIKTHFSQIPMTDARVVSWEGEFARFIVMNLHAIKNVRS